MITVLDMLQKCQGKAVSRSVLAAECGMSDRRVRKEIEKLRMAGVFIANNQDGSGYKLIAEDDCAGLSEQYRQMRKRALNILKQTTPLRRAIKKIEEENSNGKF